MKAHRGSSQPNQSLIDGIRCLQYLAANGEAIGCRELARRLDMNPTRVNRLLLTMASIGLTIQDSRKRYLPGPNIHVLAAQAIRGSSLFSKTLPILEHDAPKDIIVAMGVLWEGQVVYLYHAKPGELLTQALAGFEMRNAHQSVLGLSLLASQSDDYLQQKYSPEEWAYIQPHIVQQRNENYVQCHYDDGEISIATPIHNNQAAIAFAGIYNADDKEIKHRVHDLHQLVELINQISS